MSLLPHLPCRRSRVTQSVWTRSARLCFTRCAPPVAELVKVYVNQSEVSTRSLSQLSSSRTLNLHPKTTMVTPDRMKTREKLILILTAALRF